MRWFPVLILVACSGGDEPDADVDADADTDTDADTDVDADTDGPSLTFEGTLACPDGTAFWRVTAPAGTVSVEVDTVSADTTFDPRLFVYAVPAWPATAAQLDVSTYTLLGDGDDEEECTWPPPLYECPVADAMTDGTDVLVGVYGTVPASCAGPTAGYALSIVGATSAVHFGNVP